MNAIQSNEKPVQTAQIIQHALNTVWPLFTAAEINVELHVEKLVKEKKILLTENK